MRRQGDFDPADSGFATVVSGPPVSHWSAKIRLNFGHRSRLAVSPGKRSVSGQKPAEAGEVVRNSFKISC